MAVPAVPLAQLPPTEHRGHLPLGRLMVGSSGPGGSGSGVRLLWSRRLRLGGQAPLVPAPDGCGLLKEPADHYLNPLAEQINMWSR